MCCIFVLKRHKLAMEKKNKMTLEELPPARPVKLCKINNKRVKSFLPISTKPIPRLDVSPSSSTSLAMFANSSAKCASPPVNSFTLYEAFEDVDLSTPIVFCQPPRKSSLSTVSPFDDKHETINSTTPESSPFHDAFQCDATSDCTTLADQDERVATINSGIPSPFGDEHEVKPEVEYAPTTPASNSEYTERAMEYQRVSLLFGPESVEYNNLQRDHAMAVLEGRKPQRNDPLTDDLCWYLAMKLGDDPDDLF